MTIITAAGLSDLHNQRAFNKNGSIVTLKKISETDWILFGDLAEGNSEGFPSAHVSIPFSGGGFQEGSNGMIFGNFRGENAGVITEFGTNFINVGGVNYFCMALYYETLTMVYALATDQFEHLQTGAMSDALPSLMEGIDLFNLVTPEGELPLDGASKVQLGTSYVWMGEFDADLYNKIITAPDLYSIVPVE